MTLACFGDSLVYGFPFSPDYSWTAVLEKYGVSIINKGVCGATTGEILDNMRCAVLPESVNRVLFFGGANDIIQGVPKRVILDTVEKAKTLAAEKGWRLCLVLPLFSGEEGVNGKIGELRAELAGGTGPLSLIFSRLSGWRRKICGRRTLTAGTQRQRCMKRWESTRRPDY